MTDNVSNGMRGSKTNKCDLDIWTHATKLLVYVIHMVMEQLNPWKDTQLSK